MSAANAEKSGARSLPPRRNLMEKRLTDLEIKISFAEEQIDALNKLVYQQQRQIEWLAGELQQLRSRAEQSATGEWRSLRDEIPPHY